MTAKQEQTMSIRMDIAMFFYNFLRFWAIMGSNEGQEG